MLSKNQLLTILKKTILKSGFKPANQCCKFGTNSIDQR